MAHSRVYDLATLMIDTIESYSSEHQEQSTLPADTLLERALDAFYEIKAEIILENSETRQRTAWPSRARPAPGGKGWRKIGDAALARARDRWGRAPFRSWL